MKSPTTTVAAIRRRIDRLDIRRDDLVAERNAAIRTAHRDGVPVMALATAAGLSRRAVYDILERKHP
jgi:hypothetical protein